VDDPDDLGDKNIKQIFTSANHKCVRLNAKMLTCIQKLLHFVALGPCND
jgi:hypothetical protein